MAELKLKINKDNTAQWLDGYCPTLYQNSVQVDSITVYNERVADLSVFSLNISYSKYGSNGWETVATDKRGNYQMLRREEENEKIVWRGKVPNNVLRQFGTIKVNLFFKIKQFINGAEVLKEYAVQTTENLTFNIEKTGSTDFNLADESWGEKIEKKVDTFDEKLSVAVADVYSAVEIATSTNELTEIYKTETTARIDSYEDNVTSIVQELSQQVAEGQGTLMHIDGVGQGAVYVQEALDTMTEENSPLVTPTDSRNPVSAGAVKSCLQQEAVRVDEEIARVEETVRVNASSAELALQELSDDTIARDSEIATSIESLDAKISQDFVYKGNKDVTLANVSEGGWKIPLCRQITPIQEIIPLPAEDGADPVDLSAFVFESGKHYLVDCTLIYPHTSTNEHRPIMKPQSWYYEWESDTEIYRVGFLSVLRDGGHTFSSAITEKAEVIVIPPGKMYPGDDKIIFNSYNINVYIENGIVKITAKVGIVSLPHREFSYFPDYMPCKIKLNSIIEQNFI